MKCPNCGGNLSVNDVKCPYCGTPNPEGIAFQEEVHTRIHINEFLRKDIQEQMKLPLLHRILNLSVIILLFITFLLLGLSLILHIITDIGLPILNRPRDYEEQLEQIYQEGLYEELKHAMEQWNLDGSDYPKFTQMTILYYDYQQFQINSMNCIEAFDQGITPDTYDLEYSIKKAKELLDPYIPAYPDIYSENQEQLSVWQTEALIYLTGILNLSEENLEYDE